MNAVFNKLGDILRLRNGPQDLPSSWTVCLTLTAGYLMLGIYTGQRLGNGDSAAAGLAVTALQFAAVAVMLTVRKHPERLPQTLSALSGVGIVFTILSFLFLSQADPNKQQPVIAMAWFSIFFWSLMVDAHIYKNALSITRAQGMLIAVLLLASSYVLIEFTFKQAG